MNALLENLAQAKSDDNDILQKALDENPTMKANDQLFNFNLDLQAPQNQPKEGGDVRINQQ